MIIREAKGYVLEKQGYEKMSDEELIMRFREGEKEIEDYILSKYKNLVRKKANSMYILGGDTEDLIQEGMIGLFKAMRDYDFGRDAVFFTFADLCISRQMYTAVQASNRKKHMPLNTYISLYSEINEQGQKTHEEDKTLLWEGILQTTQLENPENLLIDRENVEYIEQVIDSQLSSLEKQVLELHITGMNYAEIARVLGRDEKSTDNALQRVKIKMKKALSEKQK